jgi:hypothetical protein
MLLPQSSELAVSTLGPCRVPSLLRERTQQFVDETSRVLVSADARDLQSFLQTGQLPPTFEPAGRAGQTGQGGFRVAPLWNERGDYHLCPGCPRCVATFEDLRQIAESIVPKQAGSVRGEVRPWDRALHRSRKRGFRPEVIACIMISHNGRFDQPVDASEEICLKQMISRLTELGVWTRQLKAPQNHSTPFVRSRVEKRRWSFCTLGTASP